MNTAPLDAAARNRIDRDVERFGRPGPVPELSVLNFWEATGGRGRLVLDRLDESLRGEPQSADRSGGPGRRIP